MATVIWQVILTKAIYALHQDIEALESWKILSKINIPKDNVKGGNK